MADVTNNIIFSEIDQFVTQLEEKYEIMNILDALEEYIAYADDLLRI